MNSVVVNIKVEPKVKKEAQRIADKLGFSLSALVKAYLKELIRTERVSFSTEEPSEFLISSLKASDQDIKKGKVSPAFSQADEAIAWLKDPARDNEN